MLRGKCGSRHGWGANVLSDFPEMFPQRAGKGGEGKGGCAAAPRVNYYLAGKRGWWWCSHQNCYWFAFLVSVTPPIRADPALLYVLLAGDFQKCVQMEKKKNQKNKLNQNLCWQVEEGMKFSRSSVQAADFRALRWQTRSRRHARTGGAHIRVQRNSSLDSTWRTSGLVELRELQSWHLSSSAPDLPCFPSLG